MRGHIKKTFSAGLMLLVLSGAFLYACTLGSDDEGEGSNVLDRGSDGLNIVLQNRYYVGSGAMDIYVSVHDEDEERPVDNLTADNFFFEEDGKDMGVEVKAGVSQENELDIVIVLDLSKSMEGGSLDNLKNAASRFVANLKGDVRVGVVTFANDYRTAQTLTTRIGHVQDVIERLKVEGDFTNLYGALYFAANLFSDGRPNVGRAVVAFTDGIDNREEKRPDDVDGIYEERDIFLYAVGLGTEDDVDSDDLEKLSTPERFYLAGQIGELDRIFTDIAADLQSTYRLRYCTPKVEGEHVLRITAESGDDSGWIEISFNAGDLTVGECNPEI